MKHHNWTPSFSLKTQKFSSKYSKIHQESEKTQNMKSVDPTIFYNFDVYINWSVAQKSSEKLSWKISKIDPSLKAVWRPNFGQDFHIDSERTRRKLLYKTCSSTCRLRFSCSWILHRSSTFQRKIAMKPVGQWPLNAFDWTSPTVSPFSTNGAQAPPAMSFPPPARAAWPLGCSRR